MLVWLVAICFCDAVCVSLGILRLEDTGWLPPRFALKEQVAVANGFSRHLVYLFLTPVSIEAASLSF